MVSSLSLNSVLSTVLLLLLFHTHHQALADSLINPKSCRDLLAYMRESGVTRAGPCGLGDQARCFYWFRRPFPSMLNPGGQPRGQPTSFAPSEAAPSAPKAQPQVEGVDFSGTNVQVRGVDEPDIVKTDGNRVFTVRSTELFFVRVTKAGSSGDLVGSLKLPLRPINMLFDAGSDNIVVIAQKYESKSTFPKSRLAVARLSFVPWFSLPSKPITVLYRISLKNDKLQIVDTTSIDGRYISARAVNGVARIVMQYDGSLYLPFVYMHQGGISSEQATKKNIAIVKKSKLSDWVPKFDSNGHYPCEDGQRGNDAKGFCGTYSMKGRLLTSCTNTYYPSDGFAGFSMLTVASVPLSGPLIPKGSSIVADGDKVYANADALYASTNRYRWDFATNALFFGRSFYSTFHKFDLTALQARYVASGRVSGSVLNQFSMHEYKGTFFAATTGGAFWWGSRDTSVSKVSSFRVVGNKLRKVGEVGGLGKGERIYAVRYIKDTAYVVTFRQVDPLYIVDLSNVKSLKVTGELKIPGYSAYLHPIGNGRLLGVGREATPQGRTTGAKVSLFDVTDVSKPKELANWSLKGSYTTAEWEHKAFLWWAPERIAVIPVTVYSTKVSDRFVGSVVLYVTDYGIEEKGRVAHTCCGTSTSTKRIERNFVIGKDHLWSLSRSALQVNLIKTLIRESTIALQ